MLWTGVLGGRKTRGQGVEGAEGQRGSLGAAGRDERIKLAGWRTGCCPATRLQAAGCVWLQRRGAMEQPVIGTVAVEPLGRGLFGQRPSIIAFSSKDKDERQTFWSLAVVGGPCFVAQDSW